MEKLTELDRIEQYTRLTDGLSNMIPVEDLSALGFFTAPASTKYHGAYEGGLFDHSFSVTKVLMSLTHSLPLTWDRKESPYIIGLYHDICKCDQYIKDGPDTYKYNDKIIIPGHADKSLFMIQKYMSLTDEEIACIRWHMGAFESDPKMWRYYTEAMKKYPNVLWTHTADCYASQIVGV